MEYNEKFQTIMIGIIAKIMMQFNNKPDLKHRRVGKVDTKFSSKAWYQFRSFRTTYVYTCLMLCYEAKADGCDGELRQ